MLTPIQRMAGNLLCREDIPIAFFLTGKDLELAQQSVVNMYEILKFWSRIDGSKEPILKIITTNNILQRQIKFDEMSGGVLCLYRYTGDPADILEVFKCRTKTVYAFRLVFVLDAALPESMACLTGIMKAEPRTKIIAQVP